MVLSADNFPLENLQLPGIHHILGPLKTKDKLVYMDNTGRDVRAVVQQNEKAVYGSTDLTALTDLVDNPTAWCYSEDIVWATQEGDLLSCTYYPEQNVLAWMKHSSTGAAFIDCAAVLDDVYFVVQRVDGEWYIERFADATETNLESDAQYGTPEFTMLPFRTADAPGQGELELVLTTPVSVSNAYAQLQEANAANINLDVIVYQDSAASASWVPCDETEQSGNDLLLCSPSIGAIAPLGPAWHPVVAFRGTERINMLQIEVDAEVNPLPVTLSGA